MEMSRRQCRAGNFPLKGKIAQRFPLSPLKNPFSSMIANRGIINECSKNVLSCLIMQFPHADKDMFDRLWCEASHCSDDGTIAKCPFLLG
jgi:hypothetical protein